MIVEIISTGDELITGSVQDTNASFLAAGFLEMGVLVKRCTMAGDDENELGTLLKESASRADIVVVTGGLGPTRDDITARTAAAAFGDKLKINNEALSCIKAFFKNKNIEMPKINEKQAYLPSRAAMLRNSRGTAPGFSMHFRKALIYFLPGVPMEMKNMFNNIVLPGIERKFKVYRRVSGKITLFGVPESKAETLLAGFSKKFPMFYLGFRAYFPMIEVKLLSSVQTPGTDMESDLERAEEWIVSKFNTDHVVSRRGLSMEEEVAALLTEQKKTVAVAESCTGGLISNMLTDVPGSSAFFLFSAVTYSNDAKVNILNVNPDTIFRHGAVHDNTAMEMAKGAMERAGADFGISTSGIAGPGGGSDEKPVGTVCIGFAQKGGSQAKTYCLNFNDRAWNKRVFAHACLNTLRKKLV